MHSQINSDPPSITSSFCESLYCPYCKDTFGSDHFYWLKSGPRRCKFHQKDKNKESAARHPRKSRRTSAPRSLCSKLQFTENPIALALSTVRQSPRFNLLRLRFPEDVLQTCRLALLEIGVENLEKATVLDWCVVSRQVQRSLYQLSIDLGHGSRRKMGESEMAISLEDWKEG